MAGAFFLLGEIRAFLMLKSGRRELNGRQNTGGYRGNRRGYHETNNCIGGVDSEFYAKGILK